MNIIKHNKKGNDLKLKLLKIGCLNCQGIINKVDDPMFEDEVKQYDMFAVNGTWLSNENKNIHIEGYKFFPLCRGKEMGKNRWYRMVY